LFQQILKKKEKGGGGGLVNARKHVTVSRKCVKIAII
jgi:hypothetical protein